MSKPRDVARILGRTEAANPSNVALALETGAPEPTTQYDSIGLLPVTGLTAGTQAFVTSTNRLYVSNGSGWYNTALINATPALSLSSSGTITLATDGTPTVITMTATDSDNADANLVLSLESGGDLFKFATVSQDSSVVTITPRSSDSATALGFDGSATLTFKASDGINQATVQNTFTLSFQADWSGSITQLRKDGVATNEMLGIGGIATNSDGTYAVLKKQGTGEIQVFTRSGSTWSVQATITPTVGSDGVVRQRNDLAGNNNLSLTDDATRLVVGDHNASLNSASEGNAYVYVRSGTSWSREAEFISSYPVAQSNQYGWAADISGDGNYVIVTDRLSSGATYGGQAWIYIRSGSSWSQQAQLTQPSGASNYGMDAKISKDGTYAVVGDWTHGSDAGRVHVWKRTGTNWAIEAILTSSDLATGDRFGEFLDINDAGDYVAVGATYDDDAGTTSGSVYIFTRSGSTWSQQAKLVPSGQSNPYRWGKNPSLDGNANFLVGSILDNGGTNKNTAILFKRTGSSWAQLVSLATNTGTESYANGIARPTFSRDGYYIIAGNGAQNPATGSNTRTGALYSYNVG